MVAPVWIVSPSCSVAAMEAAAKTRAHVLTLSGRVPAAWRAAAPVWTRTGGSASDDAETGLT